MKNSEYWKQRFGQLEDAQHNKSAAAYENIRKMYEQAERELEEKIRAWYQRFADNNAISMAEARQWLAGKDLDEFKWTVQDYIAHGKENAITAQWMKQLENASSKYHISKLESLKLKTQHSLEVLAGKYNQQMQGTLSDVYQSGYYHTAFEIQKGYNTGWDITGLDKEQIEKLISKPWAVDGYNFSTRIWGNKEKLLNEIHNELTVNLLTGSDPQKAIDKIAARMNVSKNVAGRLVQTEQAYFSSLAQGDCFNDLDVEEFEILATLDSHTSDICQGMDGQHFPMKDYEPGVTAPPFHVNCRSTTIPYFPDDIGFGERAARNADGETYYVPDNMKYKDWKNTFVDGGDKSGMDVYAVDGITHYKNHVEPEQPKPKKEYLTEKKLKANIANADVQIEDLEKQFITAANGYKYDEIIHDFGKLEDFADGNELIKLKNIQSDIDALKQQKKEWQEKLNEKIAVKQKKELVKKQLELEAKKADVEKQLADIEIKTYSGIWKDKDVTTDQWAQVNITGKKDYYNNKLLTETDPALIDKYKNLLAQVEELDKEGQNYNTIAANLNKIQYELNQVQNDLQTLNKDGIINKSADDAFSQARKDAALWFTPKNGGFKAADAYFDPPAKAIHAAATKKEHAGFYRYTSGSGGHNRPLAGFEKPWNMAGSGWERKYFKGANKVWIDFEGKGEDIRGLTTLCQKSTYDKDVWLQSGQGFGTMEGFLGLPEHTLHNLSNTDLQKFVGTEGKIPQFISTAVNKGGGGIFNAKPMKLNIYCPKGSQMLYASDVGAFGKGENELILQRGGTYKITKIYWGNDPTDGNSRKLFMDLELHPEKGYDLFQQDPNEWKGSKKNYHS